MFQMLVPDPALKPLVHVYCIVDDRAGVYEGRPVRTSPGACAVLSVNLGRPNATDGGTLVPPVSLLGIQSKARRWRAWADTHFVMAILTHAGQVRLFPHLGAGSADALVDVAAIAGDRAVRCLAAAIPADDAPRRVAAALDRWLLTRLAVTTPPAEAARFTAACAALQRNRSVASAADAAQVDRRQLQRWFHRHLGVSPKAFSALERLQRSVRAVQSGAGDALAGYSDQAHQIRAWRQHTGITPGAYDRAADRSLAAQFHTAGTGREPAFYL